MSGADQPSAIDVHRVAIAATLARFQCSFPGIVTSAEGPDGRVGVQPAIMIATKAGQQIPAKPITIPVAWPSWGGIAIQGKLGVGDEVIVECMDRNWLSWLQSGGVVPYTGTGGHQAGYAVAKPVQSSTPNRPSPLPPSTLMLIGTKDGATTIVMGADGSVSVQSSIVRIGASTSPALPVARDLDPANTTAAFTTWRTAVEAGVLAAGGGVVPPLIGLAVGTVSASSTEVTST